MFGDSCGWFAPASLSLRCRKERQRVSATDKRLSSIPLNVVVPSEGVLLRRGRDLARTTGSPAPDPSLRLKNGFAQDDASEEDEDVVRIQTDTLPNDGANDSFPSRSLQ
jgi:hypothetical protein